MILAKLHSVGQLFEGCSDSHLHHFRVGRVGSVFRANLASISALRRRQRITITGETARIQLLRFGITAGMRIQSRARLRFNPVVVGYRRQEIAIAR